MMFENIVVRGVNLLFFFCGILRGLLLIIFFHIWSTSVFFSILGFFPFVWSWMFARLWFQQGELNVHYVFKMSLPRVQPEISETSGSR